MAQYGILRNHRFTEEVTDDIRGSKLYGRDDEKLGKIDDVIFNYSTGDIFYVVIDTGGWLSTKKFIVPADYLRVSAEHEDDFAADLTRQQIESFPPYDEKDLESDQTWNDYEGRYRSKWEADPVLHRAGTDRNITPTTKQMLGSGVGTLEGRPATTNEASTSDRIVPAGSNSVEISNTAVGIGGRWDTFQSRLRERRKEVVGTGTATKQGSESAGSLRKAV